jgi:SAM-dependent methyltransferase
MTRGNIRRPPVNDLKRYEKFGWDYQWVNPLSDDEVNWHLAWARRTGGPVLALACGTGRLLCRLAAAGFDVTGVDLSKAMLRMARANAAEMPPATRKLLRFRQADMCRFDLGRQFKLIFIADNSFREAKTRADLLSCLRCIRKHLAPGGRVLITERRFNPALFPGGRRSFGWSAPLANPQTGEMVSRRGEMALCAGGRRMRGMFVYKTTLADGAERVEECPFSAPMLLKQEYLDLFAKAGLRAEVFRAYREVPDDGKEPMLCFVCSCR